MTSFADNKIDITKKFAMGRVEKIMGKGENAGYQHFLHFPQYFQKATFSWSLKFGLVLLILHPAIPVLIYTVERAL